MISVKRLFLLTLLIVILQFVLMGCQEVEEHAYFLQHRGESTENPLLEEAVSAESPLLDVFEKDPVINLLGKSFDEIILALGEPDEQGYSGWLGPHHYILFQHEEGVVLFCSPESLENKIAVSIILGPGQEVLGAKVGMTFSEIQDILGAPDFGPEPGMDDPNYTMGYFFGEMHHDMPEAFLSFSAVCMNCPTDDAFIKWEAFEYGQIEIVEVAR